MNSFLLRNKLLETCHLMCNKYLIWYWSNDPIWSMFFVFLFFSMEYQKALDPSIMHLLLMNSA